MSNSGYLMVLVESLRQEDLALQSLLSPQPPLLKALYIYESKMGAAELLHCRLTVQLVQCEVYDMRPETLTAGCMDRGTPRVLFQIHSIATDRSSSQCCVSARSSSPPVPHSTIRLQHSS